jgi:hypothetical protein
MLRERGIVPIWETSEQFAAFTSSVSVSAGTLLRELGLARA